MAEIGRGVLPRTAPATANGLPADDYLVENQRAWDYWASVGSISSQPIDALSDPEARAMLDPDGWLPWAEISKVLCLAAGGGQQGPAFGMLGCEVTVVDLSERQLSLDRQVAEKYGLAIECLQGDMCDLRFASGGEFDLVYHPISSCYVPDVGRLYREIWRVLRPRGLYRVEHWNPVHMRLWSAGQTGANGYLFPTAGTPDGPIVTPVSLGPSGEPLLTSRTFPHSLTALIGELCDSGFGVVRLAEDRGGDPEAPTGSDERLAAFVPPFFRMLARKVRRPGRARVAPARDR